MEKQWKPALGESVLFAASYTRPTQDEVEARADELDGEEGTIGYQRRMNPNPALVAVVVGVVSRQAEAPIDFGSESGEAYADWRGTIGKRRYFYAVKRKMRGRQFLVVLEDMHPAK